MPRTLATEVARRLAARSRWSPLEIVFWVIAAAAIWLLPNRHLILTEIAILALFALSLDLILGYAGIISLGHAAFFGFGAYTAALLAKHWNPDPWLGMAAAVGVATALGLLTSFLILRGSD